MILGLLTIASLGEVPPNFSPPLDAPSVFKRVAPSVVVVHVADAKGQALSLGSGVVIGPGRVATNAHVLEKGSTIVLSQGTKTWSVGSTWRDPRHDVAILQVDSLDLPAPPIGTVRDVVVGMKVFVVGAPRGLELTLSDGIVSGLRGEGIDKVVQLTAPISPGSSGGGVFDERGRLIALSSLMLEESQNLNFALPIDWVVAPNDQSVPPRSADATLLDSEASPRASRGSPHDESDVAPLKEDEEDRLLLPEPRDRTELDNALKEFVTRAESLKKALRSLKPEIPKLAAFSATSKKATPREAATKQAHDRFPASLLIRLDTMPKVDGIEAETAMNFQIHLETDVPTLRKRLDDTYDEFDRAEACVRDLQKSFAEAGPRCAWVTQACPKEVGRDEAGFFYLRTSENYALFKERVSKASELPVEAHGPWKDAHADAVDEMNDTRGTTPAAVLVMGDVQSLQFAGCRLAAQVLVGLRPTRVLLDWTHDRPWKSLATFRALCAVSKDTEPTRTRLRALSQQFPSERELQLALDEVDTQCEIDVRSRCREVFQIRDKWALAYVTATCEVRRVTSSDVRHDLARFSTEVEREEHLLLADQIDACAAAHALGYRWEYREPNPSDGCGPKARH